MNTKRSTTRKEEQKFWGGQRMLTSPHPFPDLWFGTPKRSAVTWYGCERGGALEKCQVLCYRFLSFWPSSIQTLGGKQGLALGGKKKPKKRKTLLPPAPAKRALTCSLGSASSMSHTPPWSSHIRVQPTWKSLQGTDRQPFKWQVGHEVYCKH